MVVEDGKLFSTVNGCSYLCGKLQTLSLAKLRKLANSCSYAIGRLRVCEVVADVQQLHIDAANEGAFFQAASQFNLLEMAHPDISPEQGVGIYGSDRTQGPACAVAAGAGTIYRNYFIDLKGQVGQTIDRQIDCLAELGVALGNQGCRLWEMQNGYLMTSPEALIEVNRAFSLLSEPELDQLKEKLRIGVQWHTQVTLAQSQHVVSQAYCSALPIAYNNPQVGLRSWQPFAKFVLEAAYEACICAAMINAEQTGNRRVFLTLLGGGVFGNPVGWIVESMLKVLMRYRHFGLDVAIVSYGSSKPEVRRLVDAF